MGFAGRHHAQFHLFTQNHFRKLNSRISVSDLYKYARTFDNTTHTKFGVLMNKRKKKLQNYVGKDFTAAYEQLLNWRHDFAHAGVRHTTVEEALKTHRLAKWVLLTFDDAFC